MDTAPPNSLPLHAVPAMVAPGHVLGDVRQSGDVPDLFSAHLALDTARQAASRLLLLDQPEVAVDVLMAALVANRGEADPVWILLVGPPSSGKSELLRALAACPGTIREAFLTPAALVSPDAGVETVLRRAGAGPTVLIVNDFGSLQTLPGEQRDQVFQLLRETYDGRVSKSYGKGKRDEWRGKLGLVAGGVPAVETFQSASAILGERYLVYPLATGDRQATAELALRTASKSAGLRQELAEAFLGALAATEGVDVDAVGAPPDLVSRLASLANLTSHLRTPVPWGRGHGAGPQYVPQPEGAGRLAKALLRLGQGLAVVRGRLALAEADYAVLLRVALGSVPSLRRAVVGALLARPDQDHLGQSAAVVGASTGIPPKTAEQGLRECEALRLVRVYPGTGRSHPDRFRLDAEVAQRLKTCGLGPALAASAVVPPEPPRAVWVSCGPRCQQPRLLGGPCPACGDGA